MSQNTNKLFAQVVATAEDIVAKRANMHLAVCQHLFWCLCWWYIAIGPVTLCSNVVYVKVSVAFSHTLLRHLAADVVQNTFVRKHKQCTSSYLEVGCR